MNQIFEETCINLKMPIIWSLYDRYVVPLQKHNYFKSYGIGNIIK